jgi:multidrug transporter EmrE-like cation transporter
VKPVFVVALAVYGVLSASGLILLRLFLPRAIDGFKNSNMSGRVLLAATLGLLAYTASLMIWLWMISSIELTVIYPIAVGIVTVLVAIGSILLLDEPVKLAHALGAALVLAGVTVLYRATG